MERRSLKLSLLLVALTVIADPSAWASPRNARANPSIPFAPALQNYIVLDLCANIQNISNVTLMAVDDNNNIAFGYPSADGSTYNIYKYVNGSLTLQPPLTLSAPDAGGTSMSIPLQMLANGTVFGIFQDFNSYYLGILRFYDTETGFLIANPGQDFSLLDQPEPFINHPYSEEDPGNSTRG